MKTALFTLVACVVSASVLEATFKDIENNPGVGMVVFYKSSEAHSTEVLNTVTKLASKMNKEFPGFSFRKCDGELSTNKASFDGASFTDTPYIFTINDGEGIVKYTGPKSLASVRTHVRSKFIEGKKEDTAKFTDAHSFWDLMDQDPYPKPVLVLFSEKWCQTCDRLRPGFTALATAVKGQVHVMEIQCSKDKETAAFCAAKAVSKHPMIMLFTGEDTKTFKYSADVPSLHSYQTFFAKHVSNYRKVKLGKHGKVIQPKTEPLKDNSSSQSSQLTSSGANSPASGDAGRGKVSIVEVEQRLKNVENEVVELRALLHTLKQQTA